MNQPVEIEKSSSARKARVAKGDRHKLSIDAKNFKQTRETASLFSRDAPVERKDKRKKAVKQGKKRVPAKLKTLTSENFGRRSSPLRVRLYYPKYKLQNANKTEKLDRYQRFIFNARKCIKRDYHKESNSYIVWVSEVGKFGLVCTSPFSHQAEESLVKKIETLVVESSEEDLVIWGDRLRKIEYEKEVQQKVEEIRATSCSGNIGMYTDKLSKDLLQQKADSTDVSFNEYCGNRVRDYILEYSGFYDVNLDEVKKEILDVNRKENIGDKCKWVLRVPQKIHAHLLYMSNEIGLTVQNIVYVALKK
ncbi:MAG TPA: hypothetical protein ENH88_07340 [Pseudoalteromonas prydzensis]|uniref:Uncharacterized protein n=2 Tax=root TaxID=1 RepID=A0A7V1CXP1_9GAMM|nr:hypothetical protein [Pseudoalteromonas prydzensis]HEA16248.1 hypothetical protein [Pseudoalteromonas prydzensis]